MKKIYSKFTKERDKKFQIETAIYKGENGEKRIGKRALFPEGQKHIDNMYENYRYFTEQGIDFLTPCKMEDGEIMFDFITGKSYYTEMLAALERKKKKEFLAILDRYKEIFNKLYPDREAFSNSREFEEVFGYGEICADMPSVRKLNIDLTFDNLVNMEGKTYILDYEWIFAFPVPVKFAMYRALYAIAVKHKAALYNLMTEDQLFGYFDISVTERENFAVMNENFMRYVEGKEYSYARVLNQYRKDSYYLDEELKVVNLFAQVYYDCGDGYSEQSSNIYTVLKSQKMVNIDVEIESHRNLKEIRLDPLNVGVMIRMHCLEAETAQGVKRISPEEIMNNANLSAGSDMIFRNDDPQMLIGIPQGEAWSKLHISYEILFSDLEQAEPYLAACRKKEEELKAKVEEQAALLHDSAKRFVELKEMLQLYKDKLDYIENTRAYRTFLKSKVDQIHLWDKLNQ